MRGCTASEHIERALQMTATWFEPVQDLIRATSICDVWGTPLFDRDPMKLPRKVGRYTYIYVYRRQVSIGIYTYMYLFYICVYIGKYVCDCFEYGNNPPILYGHP